MMEKKRTLTPEQKRDAERLKAIYESKKKELGISQQDIADALGISQGAVGHYLNGRNPLNFRVATVFSKALKVPIEQFSPSLAKEGVNLTTSVMPFGGLIGAAMGGIAALYQKGNVENVEQPTISGKYPLISWVSAGEWSEACEPYEIHEIDEWHSSTRHIEGPAFWLKVKGDSMTSPVGISIPEGMLILVDTAKEPKNGSLVVAKLEDANEATFKKYVIDEGIGEKYLQPLNPLHSRVKINGNCRIIGVVVQMMMDL